jgi:hypothetical protein
LDDTLIFLHNPDYSDAATFMYESDACVAVLGMRKAEVLAVDFGTGSHEYTWRRVSVRYRYETLVMGYYEPVLL